MRPRVGGQVIQLLQGGDRIVLESKGLGQISVPFAGNAQGNVGIAIRPEKLRLDRDEPSADRVRLRGRVHEIAYFGNESSIYLENPTGVEINVNVSNEARTTNSPFMTGDELWISWNATDTLVLAE